MVLEAPTGQNGLAQARLFHEAVGLTGLVLTKLDGTAKGGIVVRIWRELGVPIKLVGVGERIEDLQPFDAKAFAAALLARRMSANDGGRRALDGAGRSSWPPGAAGLTSPNPMVGAVIVRRRRGGGRGLSRGRGRRRMPRSWRWARRARAPAAPRST